jgi:hypothetical protein
MLDLDELKNSVINPTVAKEVYLQAEKRLADLLDLRKSVEQKASSFFSALHHGRAYAVRHRRCNF